jgi:hypothetical protein
MGVSSRLKPPTHIYFAQASSLLVIHLCSLSISIKMTFLLEMDITYFAYWFPLSEVISHLEFGYTSLEDWPFNIFFAFSLVTFPFMMIENDTSHALDMEGNEYDNG